VAIDRSRSSAVSKSVTISIDAMGGDHGPSVAVAGVEIAIARLAGRQVRFLLHGDKARIEAELARHPIVRAVSEVRHTDLVIAGDEKPATALRRGKGSSLWNTVEAVRAGDAQAAVSAGNTGALMAVSKLILRMAAGIDRPAIVASWPTQRGVSAVLDVGANIECDAAQLVEFAIMGEAFHCAVHGNGDPNCRPSVGLLNVGSEDVKGHEEVREAHRLLREGGIELDYRGFVEGNDIAKGTVDVVVTDGFTGNIALKTAEGMARFFSSTLRDTLTSNLAAKLGAMIAMGALKRMRARFDPSTVNGGPLLGLNGVVVKSHGGADAKGFANAIKVAADLAASDYAEHIAANVERLSAAMRAGEGAAEKAS
jgi:glycerol-3-phosphate acyltransferase PlsX